MGNNDLRKQSNIFIALSSFIGVFMLVAVFATNSALKPTYSADPIISCYECSASGTKKYAFATSDKAAGNSTSGSGCTIVADSNCATSEVGTTQCYGCQTTAGTKYTFATGYAKAQTLTSGSNCAIVIDTECDPAAIPSTGVIGGGSPAVTTNPKTGSAILYTAWAIGAVAIGYAVWYFRKLFVSK